MAVAHPGGMDEHGAHRLWRRLRSWLGGFELGTLLLVGAVAGLSWGFVELADEVVEGETHATDEKILMTLRSAGDPTDPLGPAWVEEIGRDFTALGGVGVLTLISFMASGYLLLIGKKRSAIFMLAAVGTGIVASVVLKTGFDRPRPDLVPHGSLVYTKSFPSGHSMMAAVTYLTIGALLMRAQLRRAARAYILAAAMLVAALVGISRVYLGVHWPTDVLAGWTAGGMWASTCWLIARYLQRRGRVEEPEEPAPPISA